MFTIDVYLISFLFGRDLESQAFRSGSIPSQDEINKSQQQAALLSSFNWTSKILIFVTGFIVGLPQTVDHQQHGFDRKVPWKDQKWGGRSWPAFGSHHRKIISTVGKITLPKSVSIAYDLSFNSKNPLPIGNPACSWLTNPNEGAPLSHLNRLF